MCFWEKVIINQNLTIDLTQSSEYDTKVSIETTQLLVLAFNIKDRGGKKTAVKIGKLGTNEPNTDNLLVEEHIIDFTMDFSSTVIQAKAKYRRMYRFR